MPLEARTFELVGLPGGTPLTFDQVKSVADAAVAIAYDAQPPAGPSKRLVERARNRYYDSNAIPNARPFGQIDARALPFGAFGLAFTPSLLANLYAGRATDAILTEGGYVQLDDDPGNWWVPSGRSVPDPTKLFLPASFVDPFGNATTLSYDAYVLVAASVTDARQNVTTAATDYRVMAPTTLTDPNGCQSHVSLDALGRVTALWLTGPAGEGDAFSAIRPRRVRLRVLRSGDEAAEHGARRRARDPRRSPTKWQHTPLLRRRRPDRDEEGAGRARRGEAAPGRRHMRRCERRPALVGNGRTVFDNKDNPVKQYEPYFSVTSDYHEDEDDLVCQGVTAILHYDAASRLILTEHPDGSTARVQFTPWQQVGFDGNDTILDAGNAWYAHAQIGAPAVQRAAAITTPHANTPTTSLFDTLGRTFVVIADNGGGEVQETRTTLDIEGNPLIVTDATGRACLTRQFSMLGQTCHQVSIDAGERWSLVDVLGQPLRRWDGRGQTIATSYDVLRRLVGVTVTPQGGSPLLAEKTVWGEDAPAGVTYARGRAYQRFDGAGVPTTDAYGFKGNDLDHAAAGDRLHEITRLVGSPGLDQRCSEPPRRTTREPPGPGSPRPTRACLCRLQRGRCSTRSTCRSAAPRGRRRSSPASTTTRRASARRSCGAAATTTYSYEAGDPSGCR